jgi:hypothetical protein
MREGYWIEFCMKLMTVVAWIITAVSFIALLENGTIIVFSHMNLM